MSHNLNIIFPLLLSFKAPFSASHPLILTLRLFLPSVSGIWDALTCGNNIAREALLVIRRGMSLFRQVCSPILFPPPSSPHRLFLHFLPLLSVTYHSCLCYAVLVVYLDLCYGSWESVLLEHWLRN